MSAIRIEIRGFALFSRTVIKYASYPLVLRDLKEEEEIGEKTRFGLIYVSSLCRLSSADIRTFSLTVSVSLLNNTFPCKKKNARFFFLRVDLASLVREKSKENAKKKITSKYLLFLLKTKEILVL